MHRDLYRWGCVLAAAAASLLGAARGDAMAVWPTGTWQPLRVGAGVYEDVVGDENPDSTDLVGGSDGVGTYTAGFLLQSEADDQLSLRMRLDADGTGSNNVWQFLFETDGVASTIDWVLEVRQSGNPADRQLIFAPATTGGPTFDEVVVSPTSAWTGALSAWTRWIPVTDGSLFDGDPDFFLDVAMPLSLFRSLTGLGASDAFGLGLASSTSHTQVNKDLPLGLAPTDPVSSGVVAVPESGSGALVGLGLCGLAVLARRARHARASAR